MVALLQLHLLTQHGSISLAFGRIVVDCCQIVLTSVANSLGHGCRVRAIEVVAKARQDAGKRPGGYGISLTKKYVDNIEFSDKGNEILMTKNFAQV